MSLQEQVYSVLLVSQSDKWNAALRPFLPERLYSPVLTAHSAAQAQRLLNERSVDLVLINTPLPDQFGHKLALDCSTAPHTVVLLVVKSELYEETLDKATPFGVLTLSKPTTATMIHQSLDFMRATRERLRRLEEKTVSLEDKMGEIRLVNRAKWLLIEKEGLSEGEAHHYIERLAMNHCATRREIAHSLLEKYGEEKVP